MRKTGRGATPKARAFGLKGWDMAERQLGEPIFTTAETAREAGISRDTLLRWIRRGAIPDARHRDGKNYRVWTRTEVRAIAERSAKRLGGPFGEDPAANQDSEA